MNRRSGRGIAVVLGIAGAAWACTATPLPRRASEAPCAAVPTQVAPVTQPGRSLIEKHVSSHGIEYVFRASRLANLAWQLDCLAGLQRCSRPAYDKLWAAQLHTNPALGSALDHWRELRQQNRGPVGEPAPPGRSLLPIPGHNPDLWQRLQLASVTANDATEYESFIYALTNRRTAESFLTVLRTFEPLFDSAWERALPELESAMAAQLELQARDDVARTIRSALDFYGAELGAHPVVHFDLLFRPADESETHAMQVADRGLIEVVTSEAPALRIQVPVHEMFHYAFATSAYEKREDLAFRLASSTDPNALAAYGLLDEVVATSLAQGVLGRTLTPRELALKLATPGKLYADPFIDAVSKALLPTLEQWLSSGAPRGGVFSADFSQAYLAAVARAFPRGLPPAAQLRPLACAYSKPLEPAYRSLQGRAGSPVVGSSDEPDSEDARGLLEERSSWGRVLLLKSDQTSALRRYGKLLRAPALSEIRAASRNDAAFAYATRAVGEGPVFVLVADDEPLAERLVAEFLALEVPFSGVALQVVRALPSRH